MDDEILDDIGETGETGETGDTEDLFIDREYPVFEPLPSVEGYTETVDVFPGEDIIILPYNDDILVYDEGEYLDLEIESNDVDADEEDGTDNDDEDESVDEVIDVPMSPDLEPDPDPVIDYDADEGDALPEIDETVGPDDPAPSPYIHVWRTIRQKVIDYRPSFLQSLFLKGATFYAIYDDDTEQIVTWDQVIEPNIENVEIITVEGLDIAEANNQHFWDDSNGAHVTDDEQDNWNTEYAKSNHGTLSSPTDQVPWHNLLMNSLGILLRRGLLNLVSVSKSAISFYDGLGNQDEDVTAYFGRTSAQIGRTGAKHITLTAEGITAYNADGTVAPLQAANITAAEADIDQLQADTADISTIRANSAKVASLTADALTAATAYIAALNTLNVTANDISADKATIANLTAGNVSVDTLRAASAYISALTSASVTANDISANKATLNSLIAGNVTADTLRAASAYVAALTSASVTANDISANKATLGALIAGNVTTDTLRAASAYISSLVTSNISASTITADHANVTTIIADYLTSADIQAEQIRVGQLLAGYVETDFSNADVAWIENGTIKDGAITNAMINSVSANKLTAGTIDASNITVTNLNADNITTGTINGQRIGEGSLSLSKLEDDVYTETEVDALLSTMQAEIDGAIETWTGTDVPTLNNTPASGWTTNAIKDTHVGDVYFVVNSNSQQNGYNYRFTKSGSGNSATYSWQLIKDSDVTNALSRISAAEGSITQFSSDISTLQTDTGSLATRATSLEGRMTTAEGDISTKVDTTTFNSLSDTVDGHTSSLTQLSTTTTTLNGLVSTALSDSIEYIVGTQTAKTSLWTGVTRETSLVEGKSIAYKLPYAGASTAATLNLTLADGTTTGAKPIQMVYSTSSNTGAFAGVTTHYPAGSVINMTYDGTQWVISNYNTNVNQIDRTNHSNTLGTASANENGKSYVVTASSVIGYVERLDGYQTIVTGTVVDLRWAILWATGNVAVNKTFTNAYEVFPSCTLRNNIASDWTGTQYEMAYLYGTLSGNSLTVVGITSTVPTTEDGYVYIPLGQLYSTYQIAFRTPTQKFAYLDGAFQPVEWGVKSQVTKTTNKVNEVSDTVDGHTQRIGSLETTIVTKADGSALETVSNNLSTLSQTVDTFQTTVASTYATKESVDNIQIGGRNLLPSSVISSEVDGGSTKEFSLSPSMLRAKFGNGLYFWNTFEENTQYTFSVSALRSSIDETLTGNGPIFYFSYKDGSGSSSIGFEKNAAGLVRKSMTSKAGKSIDRLYGSYGSDASVSWTYYDLKLEKGNKATDWTPAPEDMATGSALSSLTTRVSSAESTIEQHDASIALKANSADVYTKTQSDGLISTEVTNRNAAIQLAVDGINSTVSSTYATKTDLNSLEIGGRNLLRGTEYPAASSEVVLNNATVDKDGIITFIPTNNSAGISNWDNRYLDYADYGIGEYVLSFDIRLSSVESEYTEQNAACLIGYANDANWNTNNTTNTANYKYWVIDIENVTSEWQRRVFIFDTSQTPSGGSLTLQAGVYLRVGIYARAQSLPIECRRVKLEQGNKVTAWSLAPEDYEARPNLLSGTNQNTPVLPFGDDSTGCWSEYGGWKIGSGNATNGTVVLVDLLDGPKNLRYGWQVNTINSNDKDSVQSIPALKPNTYYAVSCWVRPTPDVEIPDAGVEFQFRHYGYSSATATSMGALKTYTKDLTEYGWQRLAYRFTLTEAQCAHESGRQILMFGLKGSGHYPASIQIVGAKLEIGDYATAWSPSPFDSVAMSSVNDILSRVSSAESSITQNADNIALKVSQTDYNGNQIATLINQNATTVQIQASKVDITGDVVFSAINNDTGTTKISGGKIDASSITIGQSQVTNLTTDLAAKATPSDISTAINAIEVGGRNLLRDSRPTQALGVTLDTGFWTNDGLSASVLNNALVIDGSVAATGRKRIYQPAEYFSHEAGTTYAFSCDIIATEECTISFGRKYATTNDYGVTFNVTTTKQRLSGIYTATNTNAFCIGEVSNTATVTISNLKLEKGNKATDWTPAPEDVEEGISTVQSNLNASRTWYATCPTAAATAAKIATIEPATTDFELIAGVTVAVKFTYANGVGSPTLNVNGTGAKSIKRYGTTAPSTAAASSWNAGSVVTITYDGTDWQLNNWLNNNDNHYDRENYKAALAASEAIAAAKIAVLGSDNKLKLVAENSSFDISGPILYIATAYSATDVTKATARSTNYTFWGTAFNLTNTHAIADAAAGKSVYIVGTLSGNLFTPNSTVLTCTVPTSVDGLVYMRLGIMSTAANAVLESQHPLYMFFNGAFQQCDPATVDASKTATNYISLDSTGIRIANANPATATTYQHQTFNKTEFVSSNTSVAEFGATTRIGRASHGNVLLSEDGFDYNQGDTSIFSVSPSGSEAYGIAESYSSVVTIAANDTGQVSGQYYGNSVLETPEPYYQIGSSHWLKVGEDSSDSVRVLEASSTFSMDGLVSFTFDVYNGLSQAISVQVANVYDVRAANVRIGKTNESHMMLDYHSLQLIDAEGNTYLHVSDLRDEAGYVTESFVGDGSTTSFSLTVTASSTAYVVSVDGVEQTSGVTKYTASFNFSSAPSTNAVVTARYMPLSNFKHLLKAYTLGKAKENAKIGRFSLREGYNTAANASYTHAEGYDTTAGGDCSHAEGRDTTASGLGSHAEGGDNNTASGMWSHAEGGGTLLNGVSSRPTSALGTGCHAEGCGTTAGSTSATEAAHAEGSNTVASGHNSHSEGYSTTASGYNSHAEGYSTTASGYNSHAEGYSTTASGSGSIATTSHAEGCHTIASGANSHAEGYYTTASGGSNQNGSEKSSHAEGNHTTASGDDSHAEGWHSEASGYDSHAEGGYTVASGTHSHAQNFNTKAVKTAQTAIGTFNEEDTSSTTTHPNGAAAFGQYAFIIGNGTADNARSNALTVDWSGNVDISGGLDSNGAIVSSDTLQAHDGREIFGGTSGSVLLQHKDANNAEDFRIQFYIDSNGNPAIRASLDTGSNWIYPYLNQLRSRTANTVLAGPNGSDGAPSFRSLVAADIPNINASKITAGTLGTARGGTGVSGRQSSTITVDTSNVTVGDTNHCWHNGVVCSFSYNFKPKASLANNGTLTVGTLPNDYRPPYTFVGSAYTSNASAQVDVSISTGGVITIRNVSGAAISTSITIRVGGTFAL